MIAIPWDPDLVVGALRISWHSLFAFVALLAGSFLSIRLSRWIVKDERVYGANLLDVTHVQNTGAAFGLLNAAEFPYKSAVMMGIATLALVAISLYARQLGQHEKLSRYGLALILGLWWLA